MIRTLFVSILLILLYNSTRAQITAVTGTGDEVILYDNHTWKYANKQDTATTEIQTNRLTFKKEEAATFKVSSNIATNVSVCINPKMWKFKKGDEGGSGEYKFEYTGKKEAYGMLIAERMQIPLLTLRQVAVAHATKAAPDTKVIKEEYRNVNGTNILFVEFTGTISGIGFTYFNYYYSSQRGTIQLLTYTFSSLVKDNQDQLEELLNGLTITP